MRVERDRDENGGGDVTCIKRVWLFMRIVWRPWELGYRLSAATAWTVAKIIWDGKPHSKWGEHDSHEGNHHVQEEGV